MGLVTMKSILTEAKKRRYAAGAFTFGSLDSAYAIIDAANSANMPVILQAGPLECDYAGIFELAEIARFAQRRAKTPVALNLDHGDTIELAKQAIEAGFTSVMIDASKFEYEENVKITKEVVKMAAPAGVSVEAELGRIGGAEGLIDVSDAESTQTDPDEAAEFAAKTKIDALAVAIGTGHGFYKKAPVLNIGRLKQIAAKTEVPLVLHGGSGTPEDQVLESINCGIAKVNICTEFLAAMGKAFAECQTAENFRYSYPALFEPAKNAGSGLAYEKIMFFANGFGK
ncbi:MAG: class II fructose-bisphosphate aldolase [Oscillospiraceae bacterium]|nr:class II fructose-bisphosphate aldolase [Oscillospiraceae bacterium]